MIPDFIYRMRASLFLLAISLFITCTARADVLLSEDFESYTVGTWPSPAWVQDANAINDPSNNQIVNSPGGRSGKSLKLFGQIGGCWAALAYHQFSPPTSFVLECDVYNGSEALSGCHPQRGFLGMLQGTYWANYGREFVQFLANGTFTSHGVVLGQYQVSRWYHLKIAYNRSGNQLALSYWLDGQYLGKVDTTIADTSKEDSIDHLELVAQEGSAYFDNIRVTTPALCDDFSTDTTANYNAIYWQYYGASATPSILYDAPNQRAIVQGVGGYGNIVMEKNGESPIPAGSDFTFSADLSILSEYNGYLYLGDNRPIPPVGGTGTGVRFNIGTYTAYNCDLEIYQNGVSITDLRIPYTPQSPNNLRISRVNGQYSFYVNNTLFWTQAIPALNGMALYYGVGNEISSGPSGITAQTAVDNICVTLASVEAQTAKVAIVNPDHFRILKHGLKGLGDFDYNYYSIANGSVADFGTIANPASWTGLGASPDYLTTVLTSYGYQVDVYDGTNFPSITKADYQLVIVQDPMTEVARQFNPSVEVNEPDLLQYTTNATFLSRLDSYFKGGGGVILVGDAVRLLENGANRLNYGKQIVAQNALNSVSMPSSLIPSHWLFIRGNPFCGVDRSGSGMYTVQSGILAPPGAVLSSLSLFDGNDLPPCKVWSDTVYYPADSVSLLDARVQGSGQYVIDGSVCDPPVYQVDVDFEYPNFMGYTVVNGRKLFYIGSDSFFDYQFRNYDGAWHAGQYQEIKNQIGAGGVNAILGLVQAAIPPITSDSDGDGVPDAIDQCPNTPSGSIVNATGCSIAQLVPCDGPASGGKWKSHGQYVQAVVKAATDFLKAKLITRRQWMEIVTRAAWSKCGWNRRCDHDWDGDWHRNWDCDRDRDWGRGRNWDRD